MSYNTALNPINGYQSLLNRSQFNSDQLNTNILIVNSSLTNLGTTSLVGKVDVSGITTFNNTTHIIGSLDVSGITTFNNNVNILGTLDISGTTTFNNNVYMFNNLDVSGVSTFNNGSFNNLDVSGTLTANDMILNNDLDISGKLTVEGTSTMKSQLTILNSDPGLIIEASGNTGIVVNSNTDASGSDYNYISFRSNNIDKVIIGYDDTTAHGEINKNCASIPLDIYSQTTFKSTLDVSGYPSYQTLSSDVSNNMLFIEDLQYDLSNNFNVNNINIYGSTTTYGNVGINKSPSTFALDVSGKTILRGDLVMDDATTIIAQNMISETDVSFNRVNVQSTFTVNGYGTFQTLRTDCSNNMLSIQNLQSDISGYNISLLRTDVSNNMLSIQNLQSDISGYNISQLRTDVSNNMFFINDLQYDLSNNIALNNMTANDISANNGYFQLLQANHYGSNIDISGRLTIRDASGLNPTTAKIRMIGNSENANIYGQNNSILYGFNIGFSDRLFFAKYDASGIYSDYMAINASGSVGIGTITPSEKLHLKNGNLYIDNGAFLHYSNTDALQRIWYKRSSGSTQYGGIVWNQDASGSEVGALVCWSDQNSGTLSFNRYNGQRAYYSNNTMCHIKGEYLHASNFWQMSFDRFTNNPANALQNTIQRGFYMWDVGLSNTTIMIYTGSIPKYFNISWSGFIDQTAYAFDYELRYTTSAGVERVISFTSQDVGQKGVSMNGIAYLDANGCEIRLYVRTTYITVVPGTGYFSMTATEVF